MKHLEAFGRFWYAFLVGDDWAIAAGVVVALGLTWLLAHRDVPAWWLLPLAVVGLLATSLWRTRR